MDGLSIASVECLNLLFLSENPEVEAVSAGPLPKACLEIMGLPLALELNLVVANLSLSFLSGEALKN